MELWGEDIRVEHWWSFHLRYGCGTPITVRLDRIVGVLGTAGDCALILEGKEDPVEIEDTACYVRDIVDAYRLFTS